VNTMPAPLPTVKDVRAARKQAQQATAQYVKPPLLAVLGATDAAFQTVTDAVTRVRTETADRVQDNQVRIRKALDELRARLADLPEEVSALRDRRDAAQLRKVAEAYGEVAQKAYDSLVERGEEIFGEFRSQPRVQRALTSVESGVDGAQERLETVVRDVNQVADDLLARFARSSRSTGEKAARRTQNATQQLAEQLKETSDEVAEKVTQAGDETAHTTRSTTRKAANRAQTPRRTAERRTTSKS